jgi:NAD(P)-dependent dehydrogenase (short-subunit alcohol dehydrogenase family)
MKERVALITGASRGLGLEIARLFAKRDIRLALTARDAASLARVMPELAARTDVVTVAGDVGQREHVERLYETVMNRFGRIDILVNNASSIGTSPMPALEDYPLDVFEQVLRVNLTAPLHLIQLVLPQMREREQGVIINVTSDAGVVAYEGWGGYGVSKAALEHLSRVLAEELKGSGVRLYVVDPGDMNTQMHRDAEPDADLSYLPRPKVVAPAFLRLVEEETAAFGRFAVTDQALLTRVS